MKVRHLKYVKIMTDVLSNYLTVVLEGEVESLTVFENHDDLTSQEKVKEVMAGNMDLVEAGKREIFQIE